MTMLMAETHRPVDSEQTVKDVFDARELKINQFILGRRDLFDPTGDVVKAKEAVEALAYLVAQLPPQTRRTIEMEQHQAYSSPPHYAYVVAWIANIGPDDTVLEPSAGTAGLLVHALNARPRKAWANELWDRRADLLDELSATCDQPFLVFREDAEQLDNILPADVKPTVTILNPPFSATAGRMGDKKVTSTGAAHVEQALKRLAPGGRLVCILGRGMAPDKPRFAQWWSKIRRQYTVRANIGVPGAEYAKYGTRFDTRIIVIDKCGPTVADVLTAEAGCVLDLIDLLAPVRERGKSTAVDEFISTLGDDEGADDTATTERAVQAGSGETGETLPVDAGLSGPEVHDAVAETVVGAEPEPDAGDGVFEPYKPKRLNVAGARPHPTALVESAAMASVMPPPLTYRPRIDDLAAAGLISDAQLEVVSYAGQAFQQWLPETMNDAGHPVTYRRGFFIGDGTGVGKGRELAAIIMDDFRQRRGPKKAVWVSISQKLIFDARRDWQDLGGDPEDLFPLNQYKPGQPVTHRQGILFATYATLRGGAQRDDLDPWEKRLKASDIPGSYGDWNLKELIRAANNPAKWYHAKYVEIEAGPFSGLRLPDAIKRLDPTWSPYAVDGEGKALLPSKRVIRQAMGIVCEQPKRTADKKSRLAQVQAWLGDDFDGVIAWDEGHRQKNNVLIKK